MSQSVWGGKETQYFYALTPERILDTVEKAVGIRSTGRTLQLNSMENRVFEIEMEEEERGPKYKRFRIAKFYRPGRWTREQILEEHRFIQDLAEHEIPVAAPLVLDNGSTLGEMKDEGIFFAIFAKMPGRSPDELTQDQLAITGRLLARLHNVGESRKYEHRMTLSADSYGLQNLAELQRLKLVPREIENDYADVVQRICELATPMLQRFPLQRVHGDCHLGNLLWGEQGPFWVDFDDSLSGPCVQDIWLLIPGRDEYAMEQLEILLNAYETMRKFDRLSLRLIEPLRALRFIHFSAWIGKRWQDPAFQRAFPYYGSGKYWQEQLHDLREQWALIQSLRF